jgi:hypothetical protein
MRWKLLALVFAVVSGPALAEPPSDKDLVAFLQAYMDFPTMKSASAEALAAGVQSGKLTQEQSRCIQGLISPAAMLKAARPVLLEAFPDAATVREATAFYSSPSGKKLMDFNAATLRTRVSARTRGSRPPPVASVPPTFSGQDAQASAAFKASAAGQAVTRLLNEGWPSLEKRGSESPAVTECKLHR